MTRAEYDWQDDQLVPVKTPRSNKVMHGPTPEILDVWTEVTRDEQGYAVTALTFEASIRHRALIASGARVRLNIWQFPMPPVSVSIESPFCRECDTETVFVRDRAKFVCVNKECSKFGENYEVEDIPEQPPEHSDPREQGDAAAESKADFEQGESVEPDEPLPE